MSVAGDVVTLAGVLNIAVIAGALFVTWKARVAYRQHDSRAMLLLAVGLLLLVPVASVVDVAGELLVGPVHGSQSESLLTFGVVSLLEQLLRLAGVACLLGSLYVRE